MYDFSSNGTGKSRYLKSVSNFLTQYPTYEDFAKALIAGTLPVDFNGYNANGILSRGTPYNKANVLTDETALLFGLDNTATVNQVLNLLGRDYGSASNYYGASSTSGGTRAKTVTVSNKFQLAEGARVTVRFTNGNTATNPTLNVNSTGAKQIKGSGTYNTSAPNTVYSWGAGMVIEFVYDGTYWIMVSPGANSLYFVRGTYTGTGIYGESFNPSTATRIFTGIFPVFGIIRQSGQQAREGYNLTWTDTGIFMPNPEGSQNYINVCSLETWDSPVTWDVSFYDYDSSTGCIMIHGKSAAYQLNKNGAKYNYAIAGSIFEP